MRKRNLREDTSVTVTIGTKRQTLLNTKSNFKRVFHLFGFCLLALLTFWHYMMPESSLFPSPILASTISPRNLVPGVKGAEHALETLWLWCSGQVRSLKHSLQD